MDLSSMNSEFALAGDDERGRHLKRINGRLLYPFYVFIVMLFSAVYFPTPAVFASVFLIVCAVSVYFGLQGYGEYQLFANTPVSKIDGAADELVEIQANVIPYNNLAPFDLPIGEGRCAYYGLELHFNGGGKNSQDYILSSHYQSIRTLLSDGTGYLYGNYNNAELEMPYRLYEVRHSRFELITNRQNIIQSFDETSRPGQKLDISRYDNGLVLIPITKGDLFLRTSGGGLGVRYNAAKRVSGYYVRMFYMPLDRPFFLIGKVSDSGQLYGGKPLKRFYVDPATGILAITARPKAKAISGIRSLSFLDLGLAFLCFMAFVWILGTYIL